MPVREFKRARTEFQRALLSTTDAFLAWLSGARGDKVCYLAKRIVNAIPYRYEKGRFYDVGSR